MGIAQRLPSRYPFLDNGSDLPSNPGDSTSMTTIILVSIGVLIAAAAALFMVFYGGDAFNGSDAKAQATRLVGEGVQIQAAYQAYRAQEDKLPGNGTGVDVRALKDLVCQNYLTHVPRGVGEAQPPAFDCDSSAVPSSTESPWKIDYYYGIARSVVGPVKNADGSDGSALAICRAARRSQGLSGEPKRCDAPGIDNNEPCCVMSAADAAA